MSRRIGILGGSFDPVHDGHLALARAAIRELRLDQVYFVPARVSPFKQEEPPAPARDRLRMLRLALNGFNKSRICVWEVRRPGPSYTIRTLRQFRERYPRADLYLLLGSDAVQTLPGWKDAARIPEYCQVVSAVRGGKVKSPGLSAFLRGQERAGRRGAIRWLQSKMPLASSSAVRRAAETGKLDGAPAPRTVKGYIRREGLYGAGS